MQCYPNIFIYFFYVCFKSKVESMYWVKLGNLCESINRPVTGTISLHKIEPHSLSDFKVTTNNIPVAILSVCFNDIKSCLWNSIGLTYIVEVMIQTGNKCSWSFAQVKCVDTRFMSRNQFVLSYNLVELAPGLRTQLWTTMMTYMMNDLT